ncbi:MAG: hypothetical protein H0W88_07425 [Parachlamydiaceae bacterium]|nr:hypothetical protein [Parachlamydiaceae bacterium]
MRYFTLFLLISFSFLTSLKSVDDDISQLNIQLSAECEGLTTVADCVNVISGHFFQSDIDLVSNTIDPIRIIRFYDSGCRSQSAIGAGFGFQFPLYATEIQKTSRHSYAMISEREGFLIPYRGTNESIHHKRTCQIDPRLLDVGYTNFSRMAISGRTNFINWKAIFNSEPKKNEGYWTIWLGNGSKRVYAKSCKLNYLGRFQFAIPTSNIYLLTEEIKPNGNKLTFEYKPFNGIPYLSKIQTLNRNGDQVINELNFSHSNTSSIAKSSCGHTVQYNHILEKVQIKEKDFKCDFSKRVLTQVQSTLNRITTYKTKYKDSFYTPIVKIQKANQGFKKIKYNSFGKVELIKEPCGPNEDEITTYLFEYHTDYTNVFDAIKNQTQYKFDSNKRLSSINYFDNGDIVKQEKYRWSTREGQSGWLKSKSIRLNEKIYHLTSYEYDSRGNIKEEIKFGNISGEKAEYFTTKERNLTDCYSILYEYSKDGLNLLLKKTTPEGIVKRYEYLPETNLPIKEIVEYEGKIQERIFKNYDNQGEIICLVQDDGSGENETDLKDVTWRLQKNIQRYTKSNHPSFGKPQEQNEYCLNETTKKMSLTKKIAYFYDDRGNEIKRKIYNSQNKFCYETSRVYDEYQCLRQETDPLKHVTEYEYNSENRKIKEVVLTSGKILWYDYDKVNNLKLIKEVHGENEFTTRYQYDALNRLVSETDRYGNETTYSYDVLGREFQCIKPAFQNSSGTTTHPKSTKKYNILDQIIEKIDENEFSTHYTYNIYGKPTRIQYPNETIERFSYYLDGLLKKKMEGDGTSILYEYNPRGLLIKKTYFDAAENILKCEQYAYKGSLLIQKIDGMGLKTSYQYDGAGRKIVELVDSKIRTIYEYDDFGRIVQMKKPIDKDYKIEAYTYDWLNRIASKKLLDNSGKVYFAESYEYDIYGNQVVKETLQSKGQISKKQVGYNSQNKIESIQDALGNTTIYNYSTKHEETVKIDPLGRKTKEIYDSHHRLLKRQLEGSIYYFYYDPTGKLEKQQTLVKGKNQADRDYSVIWTYNNRGWKASETELPNKTTTYHYNQIGQIIQTKKPDGVILIYEYDSLGRLKKLNSSDNMIQYTYKYDLHDNPIEIHDAVHHITQIRKYDLLDRLTEETISSGVTLQYKYDQLDRVIEVTLPDQSKIVYEYNPVHLTKIKRYNVNRQLIYESECAEYDLAGNLLSLQLPGFAINYKYDLLNRPVLIKSPHWESKLEKFDSVGNLLLTKVKDSQGEFENEFRYDRQNQIIFESTSEKNAYAYDTLGNCIKQNDQLRKINAYNQLVADKETEYRYDLNGNLQSQISPQISYKYDALNRLVECVQGGNTTNFIYDASGRCILIKENGAQKKLIYLGNKEIGSLQKGKITEFRLQDPQKYSEKTFAIELSNEIFFPIQDHRSNIVALVKDNKLVESYRHTAFKKGAESGVENPWAFANRREIANLIMFTHRFYNPKIMRWQTVDPLGFVEGMNLYKYNRNNPFLYTDPDGRFAIVLPLIVVALGGTTAIALPSLATIAAVGVGVATGVAVYQTNKWYDNKYDQELLEEEKVEEEKKGGRKKFKPDPDAEGGHTAIRRDPETGEITHYETYKPQTNPKNPNAWETEKRYDGKGNQEHFNKAEGKYIPEPHVHDPSYPGGVRPAYLDEIPKKIFN